MKYGINYIDTAPCYNTSEDVLGDALKEVPRNTYYIATKVGRNWAIGDDGKFDYTRVFDFSRSGIIKNFERSLERLGLPYVDVIQVLTIILLDSEYNMMFFNLNLPPDSRRGRAK